jgi:hypothetical protein
MWGKRIQETISERPEEEDCESYERKSSSYEKGTHRRTLTKIEKILETQKSDSHELNFLKKKSCLSKLKVEMEKGTQYIDTDAKSTKVESAERSAKDKVMLRL